MKKISQLKLNKLNQCSLSEKEQNLILGGDITCACGCHGSSGVVNNASANSQYGYDYTYGGPSVCLTWSDWDGDGTIEANEYVESAHV